MKKPEILTDKLLDCLAYGIIMMLTSWAVLGLIQVAYAYLDRDYFLFGALAGALSFIASAVRKFL